MKALKITKRIQVYRGVTWDEFGEAWTTRPTETADKKLNALRVHGLLILW